MLNIVLNIHPYFFPKSAQIVLVDKNKSVVTKAGETFISESDEWHYAKNDGKEVLISSGTILGEDGTPMMIMEEK